MLLADNAGVRVPRILLAANSPAMAMLVQRDVAGEPLGALGADRVDDALLDALWRDVVQLHEARIAHCALDGEHVLVAAGRADARGVPRSDGQRRAGPTGTRQRAATRQHRGGGGGRTGGRRGGPRLGAEALGAALPALQPAALTDATRSALGDDLDDVLTALRSAGAQVLDTEPPELRQLYRVHPRSLLMAVGALVAVGFLLSRIGDPEEFWNSIKDADWAYVGLAFVIGIATDVAFAIAFLGTVPIRLRVWPSIELQSAMSFSNLAVPVAADTAIQIRFLQKNGLDLSSAVATGGLLSTVSEILVQVGLFFAALALAPDDVNFDFVDPDTLVVTGLIVAFVLVVAVAVVAGVRKLREAVVPPVARATNTVWNAIKQPSRLALLVGGNVVAQCLYAASLLACLHAFGGSVDFFTLLALNIGVSTIASLVPIPGGGTAVSAIGLSGMLVTFGVPEATVAAAVLAHQLAVSYLPAIPGWFATRDLMRKGLL